MNKISLNTLLVVTLVLSMSLRASENDYHGMVMIFDQSEYYERKHGPATMTLQEALQTQQLFVLTSKKLLINWYLQNHSGWSFLHDNFIIKECKNMYLIVPKKFFTLEDLTLLSSSEISNISNLIRGKTPSSLEKIHGIWLTHLKTITNFSITDLTGTDFWDEIRALFLHNSAPLFSEQVTLNSTDLPAILSQVFVPKEQLADNFIWNIKIMGHGSNSYNNDNPAAAGISIPAFKNLLSFCKNKLQVGAIYLVSCFIMGKKESLFSYSNMNNLFQETYPFTIIADNIGNTPSTAWLTVGSREGIISTSKITPDILLKEPHQDYLAYFNKKVQTGTVEEVDQNFIQIRYKNTDTFLPLLDKKNKKYIAITNVMAQQERDNFIVPEETELILLYTDQINFPLTIKNRKNDPVRIVSMLPEKVMPHFKRIIFDSTADQELQAFGFLFMPRFQVYEPYIFIIDEIIFKHLSEIKANENNTTTIIDAQKPLHDLAATISAQYNPTNKDLLINKVAIMGRMKNSQGEEQTLLYTIWSDSDNMLFEKYDNTNNFALEPLINKGFISINAQTLDINELAARQNSSQSSEKINTVTPTALPETSFEKRLITALQKNRAIKQALNDPKNLERMHAALNNPSDGNIGLGSLLSPPQTYPRAMQRSTPRNQEITT